MVVKSGRRDVGVPRGDVVVRRRSRGEDDGALVIWPDLFKILKSSVFLMM